MKFIKKLFSMIALVLCGMIAFSGCTLWTLDTNKYLSQVVAKVGDSVSVTKEDLRRGYYSFGYQFVENDGMEPEEAVRQTLDILIDRAVLLDYIKTEIEANRMPDLTVKQKNEVWQSVYDYFNSSIAELEKDLMKEKDIPEALAGESNAETPGVVYTPYVKNYRIENGNLIKIIQDEEVQNVSISPYETGLSGTALANAVYENYKTKYWEYQHENIKNDALSRLIKNLKANEKDRGFSTIESEIFKRELDRAYGIYLDNKYITVFQANYEQKLSVSAGQATSYYLNMVDKQRVQYELDLASYDKNMQSEGGSIYYHPAGSEWFRVSHILLSFSDGQKNKLTKLKSDLDNLKITKVDYDKQVAAVKAGTMVDEFDKDGKKVGTKSTAAVLSELKVALAGKGYYQRCAIFNDFIYRYNSDPGVQNAEFNYYIPTNPEHDQMVKPFANESRELHKNGVLGNVSGLVETDYGYHIIFYVGGLELPAATPGLTIYDLDMFKLNAHSNKTYLDKICESVTLSQYNDYEAVLLTGLKQGKEIKIWDSYIKELWGG